MQLSQTRTQLRVVSPEAATGLRAGAVRVAAQMKAIPVPPKAIMVAGMQQCQYQRSDMRFNLWIEAAVCQNLGL